jgi:ribonuclease P protein component
LPLPGGRPRAAAYRLSGQGAFETVFRTGRRIDGRYLQLVVAPASPGIGRIGYVIGRKVLARAVDRNRVRRKLREVLRALRPAVTAYDIIVRLKRVANRSEQDAAVAEAARLLAGLLRDPS